MLSTTAPPTSSREPDILSRRIDDYERRVSEEVFGRHPLKGKAPTSGDIILRSNDYLGLTADPRVINAEIGVLQEMGHGDISARTWSHDRVDTLRKFEFKLSAAMKAQDAVLCTSGYTANIGLVQSLASPDVALYIDLKAHMSFWEGAKSAGKKPTPFRHNSPDHLARLIQRDGPGVIIVDALYSTDGALCPLKAFVELSDRSGCILVVDETHSFGTIGPDGAGLTAALGLGEHVHFRTLGLSKAVSSRGGAVVCSSRAAEYFRNSALPQIFSTAVLPHEAEGYTAILDILKSDGWRRDKLHSNHKFLSEGLHQLGYNVESSDAQIIALEAGELTQTIVLRDALEARGVFGAIFFPPATAQNRCLIRLSLNCNLSMLQLDRVLAACRDVREEVGMSRWRSTLRRQNSPRPAVSIVHRLAA